MTTTRTNPATPNLKEPVDICMTSISKQESNVLNPLQPTFITKLFPTCLFSNPINNGITLNKLCSDDANCNANPVTFAASAYQNFKYIQSVGIAFDGHIIYGPYNSNGELWSCNDHDICNGHFFTEVTTT